MLVNGSRLKSYPILSLHLGGAIARVEREIVSPHDLSVVAFEVSGPAIDNDPEIGDILDVRSVREFSNLGMIVDSTDEFVLQKDVIKIDEIMKIGFELIGKKVITRKGSKLGKVSDYIVNSDDFKIFQLIVQRPTLKSLLDPELVVAVSEVVEVTDTQIVVKDEKKSVKSKQPAKDFVPNFTNPFREPDFATIQNRNPDERDIE